MVTIDGAPTWKAPNCDLMTIFGVTDKLHWLVLSGQVEAPVIFDANYNPKPAYGSLLTELKSHAPKLKWIPTK